MVIDDREVLDLGRGHMLRFVAFRPDRSIPENAARFRDIADDPRAGAIVTHPRLGASDGSVCESYIGFNSATNTPSATWSVVSFDPLTLHPSLLCTRCGDHGWIRNGRWVPV